MTPRSPARAQGGAPERVALYTRLREDKIAEYEAVHATIPSDLEASLRSAGVHDWTIWRSRCDLFHVLLVDDYHAMRAQLATDPVNVRWQEQMAALLDEPDDYSGADTRLHQVWRLP